MKNNTGKSLIGLFLVLIIIAACGFVSWKGVDESGQGSAKNIKLGLAGSALPMRLMKKILRRRI